MSTDHSALPGIAAERLSSSVVSDILDDLGHRDHVLDPAIRPLGDGAVIAGWANPFLVTEVDEIPDVPYVGEIAALDDIAPDDVILIAAGGSARAAVWGELFSTAACVRGRPRHPDRRILPRRSDDHRARLPGVVPRHAAA